VPFSLSLLHHHHHHLVRSRRRRLLLLLLSLSSLLFSIFAFHLGEQVNEDAGLSRGEFQPADLHALATESEREIAFKP
jgi:cell division protein FtsB